MSKINILDCTFRDGGYYNNWDFEESIINQYLKAMAALPVDIVEIGFRNLPGTLSGFVGGCAFSTDNFINALNVPQGIRLAVMVNASEMIKHPSGSVDAIHSLFSDAQSSPVEMVRIAAHTNQVLQSVEMIQELKSLGYRTALNIMQISGLSGAELEALSRHASASEADVLYFADSLGSMGPGDVSNTIQGLRTHWSGDLGFHAHNNMERALMNSIQAIANGVTWIDGTVLGMGRGPGNAGTEYLAIEIESLLDRKMNHTPLLNLINTHFKSLKQQYGWGSNPFYFLAGKYGVHPSYIQEMLSDSRYSEEDILAVVEHLRSVGGNRYRLEKLESARNFYSGYVKGSWNPKSMIEGKNVLVLGSGPGSVKHRAALERFIEETHPIVVALNKQTPICSKLIDIRAVCHPVRLVADIQDHIESEQPLVIPASMLPEELLASLQGKELLDYGIEIKDKIFDFHDVYGTLPCSLVIAYVLAFSNSGGARQILLAGFDGYPAEDPRTHELNEVFEAYYMNRMAAPLISITPTLYKIDEMSVYDPIVGRNSNANGVDHTRKI